MTPDMVRGSLVRFAQRHVPTRVEWLSHADVRVGVPIHGEITVRSTSEWATRIADDESRADFVYEETEGVARVMCGVTGIDVVARRGELYMFADPEAHGSGHGSHALRLLCAWAFETRQLNRVFLYTMGSNVGARRFYERVGFVEEGCLREHAVHRGHLEDRHVHGLLARDWLGVKDALHG